MKKKLRKISSTQEWSKNILLAVLLLCLTLPAFGQINMSEEKYLVGATTLGTRAYFGGGELCNSLILF